MAFMTFHILGIIIIPTDELHHFSEGRKTTNQISWGIILANILRNNPTTNDVFEPMEPYSPDRSEPDAVTETPRCGFTIDITGTGSGDP